MRKVNPHSIELARSRIEKELREAFQTVDDADTGVINHDQLAECLVMLGLLREVYQFIPLYFVFVISFPVPPSPPPSSYFPYYFLFLDVEKSLDRQISL